MEFEARRLVLGKVMLKALCRQHVFFFYAMQVQYIYWKIKNSVQRFPQMDFAWAVYPGKLTAAQV